VKINSVPKQLSNAGVAWRYYVANDIWNAPNFINNLAGSAAVIGDPDQIVTDVQEEMLAPVSWVCPYGAPDDHPPDSVGPPQNWLATLVNAVMDSKYWQGVAIFVTWDDWGGWYDHVMPQPIDAWGPGPRVPLLVISPYAKPGYISHQQAEHS